VLAANGPGDVLWDRWFADFLLVERPETAKQQTATGLPVQMNRWRGQTTCLFEEGSQLRLSDAINCVYTLTTLRNWRSLENNPTYLKIEVVIRYRLVDVIAFEK
jgi:hypothetical protein